MVTYMTQNAVLLIPYFGITREQTLEQQKFTGKTPIFILLSVPGRCTRKVQYIPRNWKDISIPIRLLHHDDEAETPGCFPGSRWSSCLDHGVPCGQLTAICLLKTRIFSPIMSKQTTQPSEVLEFQSLQGMQTLHLIKAPGCYLYLHNGLLS